jgi:hypothetical protein
MKDMLEISSAHIAIMFDLWITDQPTNRPT